MVIVKKTMRYVIIIGLISFVILKIFNLNNMLIEPFTTNGITGYRINIDSYLINLSNVTTDVDLDIMTSLPTRTWKNPGTNWVTNEYWINIENNIALVFDWLYAPFNIILYFGRIFFYIVRLILAVLGFPTGLKAALPVGATDPYTYIMYYDSKLIGMLTWACKWLIIPYV